jgi:hypothetical protein
MPKKEIAGHVLMCARKLYEETDTPTSTIARLMGVSLKTLNRRAIRNGWTPRPGLRLRQHIAAVPISDIAALGARIRSTIEREVASAERELNKPGPRASRLAGSETAARTLASLTKTLNELKRLEAAGTEAAPKAADEQIDVEEFERDIARHLAELRSDSGGSEKT